MGRSLHWVTATREIVMLLLNRDFCNDVEQIEIGLQSARCERGGDRVWAISDASVPIAAL